MSKTIGQALARKDFRSAYQTRAVKSKSRKDKKHWVDRKRKRKLLKRVEFNEKIKASDKEAYMFLYMYRPVMSYFMDVMDLTATEVEFILFLHRFEYFESAEALKYFMTSENQKKKIFNKLVKNNFVTVAAGAIRNSVDPSIKDRYGVNVYKLSLRGKRMCHEFYQYLLQEKELPSYY